MESTKKFSRDLYPCWEVFSQEYPEHKDHMYQALYWAVNPIDDVDALCAFVDSFGMWLHNEIAIKVLHDV